MVSLARADRYVGQGKVDWMGAGLGVRGCALRLDAVDALLHCFRLSLVGG
jgi:hypothetical protein